MLTMLKGPLAPTNKVLPLHGSRLVRRAEYTKTYLLPANLDLLLLTSSAELCMLVGWFHGQHTLGGVTGGG